MSTTSTRQRRAAYSQNFLHSRRLVASLVEASSIGPDDVVFEIGPGKGIITAVLADRCRHVLAIEKDPFHADLLRHRFADVANVTVFACDALAFPLPETPYKVFANIPFRITAAIVAKLTTGVAPPLDAYLTMQREATDRFAGSGRGGATMRSIGLAPWFAVSVEHAFRRRDFLPQPAVESDLVRFAWRSEPLLPVDDRERYRQLVEAVFSAWQPTLEQALRALLPGDVAVRLRQRLGGTLRVRPSRSDVETWCALYRALAEIDDPRAWTAFAAASERLRRQQERIERPQRTRVQAR